MNQCQHQLSKSRSLNFITTLKQTRNISFCGSKVFLLCFRVLSNKRANLHIFCVKLHLRNSIHPAYQPLFLVQFSSIHPSFRFHRNYCTRATVKDTCSFDLPRFLHCQSLRENKYYVTMRTRRFRWAGGTELYSVQRGEIMLLYNVGCMGWLTAYAGRQLPYGRRKDISLRVAFESVVGVCTYFQVKWMTKIMGTLCQR